MPDDGEFEVARIVQSCPCLLCRKSFERPFPVNLRMDARITLTPWPESCRICPIRACKYVWVRSRRRHQPELDARASRLGNKRVHHLELVIDQAKIEAMKRVHG